MKAVMIREFGDPRGLAVVDLPVPVPAPGQALIAIEAAGVAGADVLIRSGALAAYGFREGHIPGGEVAGTVTAVGDGVDPAWIGQRVWAFTGTGGGYAEQAVVSIAEVLSLPAGLSAVDAVTLGSSGVVAHFGLAHAHFSPGETVLVRGAAGSIGIMAVQLAVSAGASAVAVTTSSPERGRRLRSLGATHVLDRSGAGGSDDPTGYDVIIDVVAGPDMPAFFDRLNPNGRLVAVGAVGGQPPADVGTRLMAAFQKSMSFATFSAATVTAAVRQAVRTEQFAAAAGGDLQTVVHEVLPLERAAVAHQKMDAGQVFGRIVLTVGPSTESAAPIGVVS
ncbi:zinc-binding dehydrogenase [Micromonospora sp. NPDC050795]|uniref:zinc-binding dehydrogenase n=1 Tax=Micromonospora sp. NPDC050795 TaxID=3364282 RepID=UPI003792E2AB